MYVCLWVFEYILQDQINKKNMSFDEKMGGKASAWHPAQKVPISFSNVQQGNRQTTIDSLDVSAVARTASL